MAAYKITGQYDIDDSAAVLVSAASGDVEHIVSGSNVDKRHSVILKNYGPDSVFLRGDSEVTADDWEIEANQTFADDVSHDAVYLICDTNKSANVHKLEVRG